MRVMTIKGIAIRVHYLCFLLMMVFGICGQMVEAIVIFACVVFHELCHIVVAIWLGHRAVGITLLPFGGMAEIEGMNGYGLRECMVVSAGPLGSVLGAVLCGWGWSEPSGMAELAMETNMMLALWNLLPAYPLDGGRLVRILLGTSMTAKEAVRRTVRISQLVAAVLFVYAGYVWIVRCEVLISVMLLAGMVLRLASAEEKELAFVPFCHMAGKERILTKAGYLPTMWYTVRCDMRAGEVIELFRPQVYTMVRVVSTGGKLCGTLSETAVWQGLTTYRLTDAIGIFCDEEE